jgi:methylenetetrahydrofolate reductase (NADPH)
MNLEASCL